jgi:hypothetical protein
MVTKEQCLLNRVLDELEYGRNDRLAQYVLAAYNQGKKYASDMIFQNDENGFYQALNGWGKDEICKIFYETLGYFDKSAPFFTVDYKLNSVDMDEFIRMLTPEDKQKLINDDILGELDGTDITDAFDTFVYSNFPQVYDNIDFDWLYDIGYRTEYQILNADWNELVKELQQYAQQHGQVNETKTVKLNEMDLRKMTNKILKEIVGKGKK